MAPYASGVALFLNSTATSYHWGCYGTSVMIHRKLEEAGYLVNAVPVEVTHAALPTPPLRTPIDFEGYAKSLESLNLAVFLGVRDADIVVINGEGTLHRRHDGPISLLALMAYAKHLGKPVHLINHACFPNGDAGVASKEVEDFYRYCLTGLDTIAVRDPVSGSAYARWGIPYVQAFDSLPLYIKNYIPPQTTVNDNVLVSAASWWPDHETTAVAKAVLNGVGGRKVSFLGGGYKRPPPEDAIHHGFMAKVIPNLDLLAHPTITEWVDEISRARLLVTGRFHHYIAALCTGTPVVLMPGNTPKCAAVAEWMEQPVSSPLDPRLVDDIRHALSIPYDRAGPTGAAVLSQNNFGFLK